MGAVFLRGEIMLILDILTNATNERNSILHEVTALGAIVGDLKQERARLLMENDLKGDSPEVMKINERLHNARRVLSALNRRRENLEFVMNYVIKEPEKIDDKREERP